MSLTAGAQLGSFEILAAIGAGGMGEVYRARDTKLNRDVALKILPDAVAGDPDRIARFQREAQILAALHHPNIATIHGLDESGGTKFLILELVEGESLDARLKRASKAMEHEEAVAIAVQMIDAIEAAHEKGIIHRDLKPANVMLTPEGRVKVLDFGLGKYEPAYASAVSGLTQSPTLTFAATQAGVILGTAAYMAPEQAKGRAADKRSDVWAFGCVLYELLAGKRAFEGEDVADVLASVLKGEPDWNGIPGDVPAHVVTVVKRCLVKDRGARIPDMAVVRFLLNEFPRVAAPGLLAASPRGGARAGLIAAAIAIGSLLVGGAAMWLVMRQAPLKIQPVRFSIVPPSTAPFNVQGFFRNITISPDGANLVYVSGASTSARSGQLIVRPIDQLEPAVLHGIDDGAGFPFISPDGRWVGYFAGGVNGELKKVAISGGPPVTLCRFQGTARGASWGADETIVFATNDTSTGLMTVPAGGGEPKVLTTPDTAHGEEDHLFPSWLPDGRSVLYTSLPAPNNIANAQVAMLDLSTGQSKALVRGGSDAQYVESGHLVYASAGTLRAVRFDPVRREVLSDPVPVLDQVMMLNSGAADFRVSTQGTLAYVPGGFGAVSPSRTLAWVTRQGREEPINAPLRAYAMPRLSPDGTRAALDIRDQESDIWIWEFARQILTRLTTDPASDTNPVWTPDGRRVVFAHARSGLGLLFWQPTDGTGTADRLSTGPAPQTATSFSPDGKTLIFSEISLKTGSDVMQLHLEGAPKAEPLIQTTFAEGAGEISPDGRWIAYQSTESGQLEVYVRPFPKVDGGRWLISTGGGTRPAWSKNGRELFYLAPNAAMMAVPVQAGPTFNPGSPSKLFDGSPWISTLAGRMYDVAPDGRFLMVRDAAADSNRPAVSAPINVVVHWTEELKTRVPSK